MNPIIVRAVVGGYQVRLRAKGRMTDQPARPRFGYIINDTGNAANVARGDRRLITFHSTNDPTQFAAKWVDDESDVYLAQGDIVHIDVIGPGQSIVLAGVRSGWWPV